MELGQVGGGQSTDQIGHAVGVIHLVEDVEGLPELASLLEQDRTGPDAPIGRPGDDRRLSPEVVHPGGLAVDRRQRDPADDLPGRSGPSGDDLGQLVVDHREPGELDERRSAGRFDRGQDLLPEEVIGDRRP